MLGYLLNYMETCHYLHENESCDEVAERALEELGKGYLLTLHGDYHVLGDCMTGVPVKVPVDNGYIEFQYHTVLCISGGYILDPLLFESYGGVIEYAKYFDMVEDLNPGKNINTYTGSVNY